jgi:photosystem II stability/assembly factor-like uncharacterized protein
MKRLLPILLLFLFSSLIFAQNQLTSQTLSGLKLRNIGPAIMSGRIVDLAVVESNPITFYVATATGGLWKTTNNGITFTPVFQNEGTHSIGAIAVHQKSSKFVWVGTGERANRQSSSWGDGIYLSSNSGRSWKNIGLKDSHQIGRIVLHPEDTSIAYVAAMGHLWGPNPERGLYKTSDGGKSWVQLLYVDENTGVVDVAMDPSDPNILYCATYQRRRTPYGFDGDGPGSALYKSMDAGKTWRKIHNGLPAGEYGRIGISIYRKDPKIVYVCVEQGYQYNASTAYNRRKAGVYRSDDKGESWTFMSDWNPRPMYASQILVDPVDDKRVYMMNQYSYSDDGGKTFRPVRQSLHGDDRILWVNSKNNHHVIKGDDGGLGISYDRGRTWLYSTNLPVSQFYRVRVDNKKPYWVYGGLQDNGSWYGPNETYRSDGIRNEDWIRSGGGDGFLSIPHPTDEDIIFGESQYLGLFRMNTKTREVKSIRPGDPKGHISARRNWDAWGPGIPEPELGNAMAPANWDGPYILSPHDPNTVYAGTNILWKSNNMGDTWISLGDLTTKVNRRDLKIMGARADTATASLDDGVPYYPTLTVIEESPLKAGALYVGTDDGNLHVSLDDGKTWSNVTKKVPGLPETSWIAGIEASKFNEATAYMVANNYRNNDFKNYVYKTTDYGKSWSSIVGNLPEGRVARTIREDPKNPELLYLATEIGFFITINGGKNWVELKNNMPTAAFNDMVIHPRDNDLVLATHGRGVWILDNLSALQELTPKVFASEANLFSIPLAERINYSREGAHTGDMFFRGENPPRGAIIDYYLKSPVAKSEITLEILTIDGATLQKLRVDTTVGINRSTWNLTGPSLPVRPTNPYDTTRRGGGFGGFFGFGGGGAPVMPGTYTARLTVKGKSFEQKFEVKDDPRLEISVEARKEWDNQLRQIMALYSDIMDELKVVQQVQWAVEKLQGDKKIVDQVIADEVEETTELYNELLNRCRGLFREVTNWTGSLTSDQLAQKEYYSEMIGKLAPRKKNIVDNIISELNKLLDEKDKIKVSVEE